MAKVRKPGYGWLLALTIILTLAALGTLLPQASASKECMLGYAAHCTFTPVSTIICLLMVGGVCKLRSMKLTGDEWHRWEETPCVVEEEDPDCRSPLTCLRA